MLQSSNGEALLQNGYFLAIGIIDGGNTVHIYAVKTNGFEEIDGASYIENSAVICSKVYLSPTQDHTQIKAFAEKIVEKELEISYLKDEGKGLGISF